MYDFLTKRKTKEHQVCYYVSIKGQKCPIIENRIIMIR